MRTAEDACRSVAAASPDVLHVDVENAVGELAKEADVIDALVGEVGGKA
jgi:hypothetical protein